MLPEHFPARSGEFLWLQWAEVGRAGLRTGRGAPKGAGCGTAACGAATLSQPRAQRLGELLHPAERKNSDLLVLEQTHDELMPGIFRRGRYFGNGRKLHVRRARMRSAV